MNIDNKRITPDFVTKLAPNEIFVFGSNIEGHHLGGAARIAYEKFGAVYGQGVGAQGQSYAIPTMFNTLAEIKPYADEFIEYARKHLENRFLLTRVGCGIAGFHDSEMSQLFKAVADLPNVTIPREWVKYI